ncbi:hypothetical protein [Terasakiella pusilla]|uniref:hypothetical protein n=1 Tax=Terasakiella pusilla TaxID=64973 RepID=UPI003AA976C5
MTTHHEPSEYWANHFSFDHAVWKTITQSDVSDELKNCILKLQKSTVSPYSAEAKKLNFLSRIQYETDFFAFQMHRRMFSAPPTSMNRRVEWILRSSQDLSKLLSEGECFLATPPSVSRDKMLTDMSIVLEKFSLLKLEKNNPDLILEEQEQAEIKGLMDEARKSFLTKKPKAALQLLVNKKISELHEEEYCLGTLSTVFIYDLLQKLYELEQCAEAILKIPTGKGRGENPHTGEYLKTIHNIYCKQFKRNKIDNDFNILAVLLLNMVDKSLKNSFGSIGKDAIKNMGADAIRKAIERSKK